MGRVLTQILGLCIYDVGLIGCNHAFCGTITCILHRRQAVACILSQPGEEELQLFAIGLSASDTLCWKENC